MKKYLAMLLAVVLCLSAMPVFAATGTICETCNGTGKTACTWCDGTGAMQAAGVRLFCGTCGGSGEMKCLGRCGGDGVIEDGKASGETRKQGSVCETCKGTGKNACTWCDATGIVEIAGTRYYCSTCGGSGEMKCLGKCGGDGIIEAASESGGSLYSGGMINPYGGDSACAICRGSGQKQCPSCGGTGSSTRIQYGTNFGFGGSSYSMDSRCAACRGTGRVICTYCLGNG